MMKKALVVGIDAYSESALNTCINDACKIEGLLAHNADGTPNFEVVRNDNVSKKCILKAAIEKLFADAPDIETALFYYSGHGMFDGMRGYLALPDVFDTHDGLEFQHILDIANKSTIPNKIIILDCCHAGAISVSTSAVMQPFVGRGVTILAASRESESAYEGVFTNLLCEALRGGAASVDGSVTPGSVYAFIDRALGAWCQRPVFVSHVTRFVSLRKCVPRIPLEVVRNIPKYFPAEASEYRLDPSYEDTNVPGVEHKYVEPYGESSHIAIFKELQKMQSVGLVEPVDAPFMYFAAMKSKSCRLTALGAHYRKLASDGLI